MTTALGWTASYPITYTFLWGDGAANVTSQSCLSCTAYPGVNGVSLPGIGMAMHTYNVAGTYNAIINVSDTMGVFRSDTYKVIVYSVTYPLAWWRVFIEGAGKVANLTRQTYVAGPITAYLYNNGSAPLMGGFTAYWYEDSWANMIYSHTFSQDIFPGEYFPFAWPGNVPQVTTTPGTHHFWVKTACFGCSGYGANISSPAMTTVYQTAAVSPSMTVTQVSGSIANLQQGQATVIKYHVVNNGPFTINWFDQPLLTGSIIVFPEPAELYAQYGPVINASIQSYVLSPFSIPGGGTIPATDESNSPLTNLGYLLQPGEDVTLSQEVYYPPTTNQQLSGGLEQQFTPYAAATCTAATTSNGASCGIGGNQITATTTISTGGPAPASITTGYGQQIGNGSVLLVGYVNSLGVSAVIQVWFQFTVPNGTVYTTTQQLFTGPATVRQYLYGMPIGNYSMTMYGTTGGGQNLVGATVTFTVGISSGANNAGSSGEGAVTNFLYSWAVALNMPAVFIGFILGVFLLFGGVAVLLILQFYFEAEIPSVVWLVMLLILMGLNIGIFLWPDWLALVIFTVVGLMLLDELRGSSAGGEVSG